MTPEIRLNGVRIGAHGVVSDVQDSTIWRSEGWSGDYQMQCQWSAGFNFSAPWFHAGAVAEVVEAGLTTWAGVLAEPTPGADGTWTLAANGFGVLADQWRAFAVDAAPPTGADAVKTTLTANAAVDLAHTDRDFPLDRHGNALGAAAVGDVDGTTATIAGLMTLTSKAEGKRWLVDSRGEMSLVEDPEMPVWTMTPNQAYLGTADDQFVTHMWGYFVAGVDGTSGEPNAWGYVLAAGSATLGAEMAEQNTRREVVVDLTPLGLLPVSVAQLNIDNRFKLVGARMGWTNGVELTSLNVRRLGFGPASPLAVRAGDMLRIPGVIDARSNPTTGAAVDIVLAEVRRYHAENRATATPIGYAPRDFAGALAAAQTPPAQTVAA